MVNSPTIKVVADRAVYWRCHVKVLQILQSFCTGSGRSTGSLLWRASGLQRPFIVQKLQWKLAADMRQMARVWAADEGVADSPAIQIGT